MININAETPFRNSVLLYLCKEAHDHGTRLLQLAAAAGLDEQDLRAACAARAEYLKKRYGIDDKYRAVFEEHALRAVGLVGLA